MAAAANPLATEAGREILRAGGSAVDAAIAIQMVLTLVEPQSSGIGGGAFLLHWDGRKVVAYDGRETAPMAADEKLFLLPDGKAMPFYDAVVGGRSVGTPGAVRMLEVAHKQYGKLPWARLFEPAIQLADGGFPMSPRLNMQLAAEKYLKSDAACGRVLLRRRRYAEGGRYSDAQSGAGRDAARHRRQSEFVLRRRHSVRHRQGCARASERRPARRDRLRRVSGQAARADMHRLQAVARLRLSTAVVGRHRGGANARHLRRSQHRGSAADGRDGSRRQARAAAGCGASVFRSWPARFRRSRPVCRRQRFRQSQRCRPA